MSKLISLFDMAGYGVYVWPCYVLLLGFIGWQVFVALKKNTAVRKNIKDTSE